jgi:hypothetical protein
MKQRTTVQAVAAIVVLVFFVGIWASGDRVDVGWLRFFSIAVLIATAALGLWDRFLWKLSVAQRVRTVPRDISGTWKGVLSSFWIDPESGKRIDPKPAFLVIRQTASSLWVTLLTDESKSRSSLGRVSSEDGSSFVNYMYLNKPDVGVEHRSRIHHGSTSLDITGCPATRLKGRYWTDRDTKGELDFKERKQKTVDDYDEAQALFA